jgi:endogenous inhibitor of DNA gyrase (YacG/DUF329 family)
MSNSKRRICPICGTEFFVRPSQANRECCSRRCMGIAHTKKADSQCITVTCAHCGTLFKTTPGKVNRGRKYCSKTCSYAAKTGTGPRAVCEICGEVFIARPIDLQERHARFCSSQCLSKYRKSLGRDRFWSKVSKDGPVLNTELGPCWEWMGSCSRGYGVTHIDGSREFAHRFSWRDRNGEIPDGLDVCHKCDNPKCVNPGHLFVGTEKDNMLDMIKKGRGGNTKLTVHQVLEIRSNYLAGNVTQSRLSAEYGVTPSAIWSIVTGKTWKHIL